MSDVELVGAARTSVSYHAVATFIRVNFTRSDFSSFSGRDAGSALYAHTAQAYCHGEWRVCVARRVTRLVG